MQSAVSTIVMQKVLSNTKYKSNADIGDETVGGILVYSYYLLDIYCIFIGCFIGYLLDILLGIYLIFYMDILLGIYWMFYWIFVGHFGGYLLSVC